MDKFIRQMRLSHIIIIGVVLTLLVSCLSRGFYHPDEHYQILEYAGYKLFNNISVDNLAWEFSLMMRPSLQPFFAYLAGCFLTYFGFYSPWLLIGVLQVFSGCISLYCLWFFFKTIRSEFDDYWQKWFLLLGLCLWFMTYLHVHYTSEMLAGNLLLLLSSLSIRNTRAVGSRCSVFGGLLMGLVAGLLFIVKFQMGFALLGWFIWIMVFHFNWRMLLGLLFGGLFILFLGILSDYWLYDTWTFTAWNYLRENILNSHMDKFGSEPWYHYFTSAILDGGILFGLLMLVSVIWFFIRFPRSVITWMLIPFLLVHFFLMHKELRFFFPALFFAPYFVVLFFRNSAFMCRFVRTRFWRVLFFVMMFFNFVSIFYMICINNPDTAFYKMMERHCEGKSSVSVFSLNEGKSYYTQYQTFTDPRLVVTRFYMPKNMDLYTYDSLSALNHAVSEIVHSPSDPIYILSSDPDLSSSSALILEKIIWDPYPFWIGRYFNFNDWISRSIRSKNVYKVLPNTNQS